MYVLCNFYTALPMKTFSAAHAFCKFPQLWRVMRFDSVDRGQQCRKFKSADSDLLLFLPFPALASEACGKFSDNSPIRKSNFFILWWSVEKKRRRTFFFSFQSEKRKKYEELQYKNSQINNNNNNNNYKNN